jgi:hypothetical protein
VAESGRRGDPGLREDGGEYVGLKAEHKVADPMIEATTPVYGQNTTKNVDKTRGFRPPYVWTKTFIFPLTLGYRLGNSLVG